MFKQKLKEHLQSTTQHTRKSSADEIGECNGKSPITAWTTPCLLNFTTPNPNRNPIVKNSVINILLRMSHFPAMYNFCPGSLFSFYPPNRGNVEKTVRETWGQMDVTPSSRRRVSKVLTTLIYDVFSTLSLSYVYSKPILGLFSFTCILICVYSILHHCGQNETAGSELIYERIHSAVDAHELILLSKHDHSKTLQNLPV